MSAPQHSRILILGSGPAGYAAALYAARANLAPILVTGMAQGGQLMTTQDVENWPGDPDGVEGPVLMQRLHQHVENLGVHIVYDHVDHAQLNSRPFRLRGSGGEYSCDALVIATGATARYLGLPSESLYSGKGVSGCATCDGYQFKDHDVCVIGGGNTALEEALFMCNLASHVHLVHRRSKFKADPILVDRLPAKVAEGRLTLHLGCTLAEVLGDGEAVTGAVLRSVAGDAVTQLAVKGCFIAIGHQPNTSLFLDQLSMKDGYIVTGLQHRTLTATSVPGVFAAGDVQDPVYRQAITSAGSGCMAALDAQRFLEGECA